MPTNAPPVLVLGTRNRKKGIELLDLLRPLGIDVRTLADYPRAIEVVEDGKTFAENAAKKARQQALHLGQWVLGEDSGLAVDALGGAPGVYSARYSSLAGGHEAKNDGANVDEANNDRLLRELGDAPLERRTAHYVCHAELADPRGAIRGMAEGRCQGRILFQRRGTGGFGYDPLFEIVEYHRTFGELGAAVKAALSHRARALRQLVPQIAQLLAAGQWK